MQNHIGREGATLEPPPPVQRIYTPPSVKILFSQNQCKSSIRKFSAAAIKTYTSQYNKNAIHNPFKPLTLIGEEFSDLTKSLSFVPCPMKTYKREITKSWSNFKTYMLKQYFF